jgi:hypothetical protein
MAQTPQLKWDKVTQNKKYCNMPSLLTSLMCFFSLELIVLYSLLHSLSIQSFKMKCLLVPVHSEMSSSPRNENLNLLVRIMKILNLFLYIVLNWKINWSKQSFTGLGLEDGVTLWRLLCFLVRAGFEISRYLHL